jgi:hypothetical protein
MPVHIIKTHINGKDCTHTLLCCDVMPKDVSPWVDINQADFRQVTCTGCLAELEKRSDLFRDAEVIKSELIEWPPKELEMLHWYFILPDEDGDNRMVAFNALCEKFGDDIFVVAEKGDFLLRKYHRQGKAVIQAVLYRL